MKPTVGRGVTRDSNQKNNGKRLIKISMKKKEIEIPTLGRSNS
jgi:hypothetical protein